ncbi:MAG: DMT family transporter [Desulforhopalus sp.]
MKNLKAYLCCIFVVFVWSGWITISRYGVMTPLQPADITLLRYTTALLCVSPLILRYEWKQHRIHHYMVVGLGIGFPYTLVTFYGLQAIKAAHAGVLVNGMLPVLGAIAAWYLLHQRISSFRYFAIALIFMSNLIMTGSDTFSSGHGLGICLLFLAAVFYTMHITGIKLWNFTWKDTLVSVSVVNGVLFVPLWFFLPSRLMQANILDIISQAAYQGVLVNVIALIFATYAVRQLGTITMSIFMSFVPITTALLAWLLLGERLNPWEFAGIAGCSMGLFIYSQGLLMESRGASLD